MTVYTDLPRWPGRGRLWSHLVSDASPAELHAFAEACGVPRRAFERDHYDLTAEAHRLAVTLGARVVPSRELVRLLTTAGLRRPKRRGRPRRPPAAPSPAAGSLPPGGAVGPGAEKS
ncbi:hypothetical protein Athai_03230 [Actinocatenispora thailandica]|uniref:DUF4031 domain-containing protein n=1 Tax=Actinocatenispora thailandica TaxID=227318 RepID=A0A7R7DJJ7_9ACTN|nr:DUF4031 domain-containing protein [Actinocatenispora thailandica]BCJ32820.1 hypothetical protein Athai_03230 [Actinocatenispora thailandica]